MSTNETNQESESGSADCSSVLDHLCVELIENVLRECCWVRIDQGLPPLGMLCFLETERGVIIGSRDDVVDDGWIWSEGCGTPWHNGDKWECDLEGDDIQVTNWMPLPHPRKMKGGAP